MIDFIICVSTIGQFDRLGLIAILIDFIMDIEFRLAVLRINIRRFLIGLREKIKRNDEIIKHKEMFRSLTNDNSLARFETASTATLPTISTDTRANLTTSDQVSSSSSPNHCDILSIVCHC